jgi:Epoxide hydrolase N terminus
MTTIQPFRIDISPEILDDLQQRLQNTRWLQPVKEDAGWEHGMNVAYLKELVDYWLHTYNWREQEKELNQSDHFKTKIDDYNLHFIHQRGKSSNPTPSCFYMAGRTRFFVFKRSSRC